MGVISGLKDLIKACSDAFDAFKVVFELLPLAIRIYIYAAVGLFVLFGFFKLLHK